MKQVTLEEKLYVTKFKADDRSHLGVKDPSRCLECVHKQCTIACPTRCWARNEDGTVTVSYEGCVECGTCRIVCNEFRNVYWVYPRGGYGVIYRYG